MTSSSKWACPTCTFNNWQSLSKCILCGSQKPSDEVIPRTPVAKYRQQKNSGWSKLSPSLPGGGVGPLQPPSKHMEPNIPQAVDSSSTNSSNVTTKGSAKCKTKGKWACVSCTSLNWSNAGQCTCCGTPRQRSARHEIGRAPNRSSESILLYASGAVGGASVSGSCDVPFQQQAAKAKNGRHGNRGGQGIGGGAENRKWKCQHCTYENWPRTLKCTMCLRPKNRTPSPPLSGSEDSTLSATPLSSLHHGRGQPSSPQLHSPTPPNSNTIPAPTPSPALPRAHSNSNDTCEALSNSKDTEAGINANKLAAGCNIPSVVGAQADSGTKSVRERRISDRYNSTPRQIQLKSDTDEVRFIVISYSPLSTQQSMWSAQFFDPEEVV